VTTQKATNVTWQDGEVSRQDRFTILKQRGATIWFTGLSGSGKSTVAIALEQALYSIGKLSYRLDGDNTRILASRKKIARKIFAVLVRSQNYLAMPA